MPIRNAIWTVGTNPQQLTEGRLPNERTLEDMIVASPRMLSDEWMLIGRQERTLSGGYIDLLAIAPDGALVLIELKRDRTPREVVAQAIDYAVWVEGLESQDIVSIYKRFAPGRDLAEDFQSRFGQSLDEETLNSSHQIVIVAASLDDSSERIVSYLNKRDIAINVLCFQVFDLGGQQLLSRAWLLDPVHTQVSATSTPKSRGTRESEPWNGEFYASFGEGSARSWDEARKYGFISAGGGAWYSNTLNLLEQGDRIWVRAPKQGFIGVGEVTGPRLSISELVIQTPEGERAAADVLTGAHYHRMFEDDPERAEYFIPVRWLHTVALNEAVDEIGLFGNQNTVCKPTTPKWRTTVERLKERWSLQS
ncbi:MULTISPECIES: endonuclease NucS domain-containing protein [unclassified Brevundimonas]|uniref:endonuclease NucS domain-containing protein n=1 Tax=unclassified Brevundimonas TaxID=2622653 RepID=UPI0025C415EB|nr:MULTISPECIES: endonuclease NucS domain-containing protein [unclassified Brevundimonas]